MLRSVSSVSGVILTSALIAGVCFAVPLAQPAAQAGKAISLRSSEGAPLTAEDKAAIVSAVLAHPQLAATREQKVKALSVFTEDATKPSPKGAAPSRQATVIFFNYTQNRAIRVQVNIATGVVSAPEDLPGRPTPSVEEIEEASRIIRSDPRHAELLQTGVLEGGFVVDPPGAAGAGTAQGRFMQFHILSSDRTSIQRVVYVNLTTGAIAASESR
jgi:hypothetical protein